MKSKIWIKRAFLPLEGKVQMSDVEEPFQISQSFRTSASFLVKEKGEPFFLSKKWEFIVHWGTRE